MIYFIQAGRDGPIKIGHAGDVLRRVSEIQSNNHMPITLLRVRKGGLAEERAMLFQIQQ